MNKKLLTGTGLIVALALFFGINIIANQTLTRLRLDVTDAKLHTLSDGTRNILAAIDEPITLRFFFSAEKFAAVPEFATYGKRVRDLLEEYAAESAGMIRLVVIDPEPFSEAEDQAVGFGIEPVPMNASGERGFIRLVGTNSTDDEIPIPVMSPGTGKCARIRVDENDLQLVEPGEARTRTYFRFACLERCSRSANGSDAAA